MTWTFLKRNNLDAEIDTGGTGYYVSIIDRRTGTSLLGERGRTVETALARCVRLMREHPEDYWHRERSRR